LLKQFIKQHWQEDEDNFVPPVVSASEKVVIRKLLLTSLDDSHGKIRTAISMAVAAIGQQDWPEDWPELLPLLLKLISNQNNGNGGWFTSYPALLPHLPVVFALEIQCSLNLNNLILGCCHGSRTVFLTALCTEILHMKNT